MLRVIENPKPQSRPEIFDNSAKLDLSKKEGNPDFEPLVIARPTELIEKLLPRFDSSCKKLTEEKTDEKESLDSECNSIIHANSTKDEIANNPAITLSQNCDSASHAKSTKDGVTTDSVPSVDNSMNSQNTESKFEILKYNTQKERDKLLLKLLCENRVRRKSIVNENAFPPDIENKCTLQKEKVDVGGETLQPKCTLTMCGGGELLQRTPSLHVGGGRLTLNNHTWGILIHNHRACSISTLEQFLNINIHHFGTVYTIGLLHYQIWFTFYLLFSVFYITSCQIAFLLF
jgi:hypothetical protein